MNPRSFEVDPHRYESIPNCCPSGPIGQDYMLTDWLVEFGAWSTPALAGPMLSGDGLAQLRGLPSRIELSSALASRR